jgi:hypothetical protein
VRPHKQWPFFPAQGVWFLGRLLGNPVKKEKLSESAGSRHQKNSIISLMTIQKIAAIPRIYFSIR